MQAMRGEAQTTATFLEEEIFTSYGEICDLIY